MKRLLFLTACVLVVNTVTPGFCQNTSSGGINDYAYYTRQANVYIEQGQLTKAIEMFEKAYPLAPEISVPVIHNNLAVIYMKRGNYFHQHEKNEEKALNDFRHAYYVMHYGWPEGLEQKALHEKNLKIARDNVSIAYQNLKIDPNNAKEHMELAKGLRMQGKFPEAVVEYARVTEIDDQNLEAYQALGDLFQVLNHPAKSKNYYQKAVSLSGDDVNDDLLVKLANAQNQSGEVDTAVANLNRALAVNPDNMGALNQLEGIWKREIKFNPSSALGHANLASVFQKKKRYDEALNQYNAAEYFANQDPSTPFDVKKQIRLNVGTLYQEHKNYSMAMKAYESVLQVDPNHLSANYYRASLLKDTGKSSDAMQAYNRVLAIDPQYEAAHADLLELIQKQPIPQKVDTDLRAYADKYPQNALVQTKVGEVFHQRKAYDDAAEFYQRAIRLKPNQAEAYANLGAVLQVQGKAPEALKAFQKAHELSPDNVTFSKLLADAREIQGFKHYQEAISLQQKGDHRAAIPAFEQALASDPDNAELLAAYGVALQNTQQVDKAIVQYRKAVDLKPENPLYHYYLGTALHQNQDYVLAKASYQKALQLEKTPDSVVATQAKQAIDLLSSSEAASFLEKAVDAYNRKSFSQALTYVQKAIELDRANSTAYYYQGLIYNDQNRVDAAIQSYEKAIAVDAGFHDAYFGLGVAQDKKQNKAAAKQAFQKYIDLANGQEDDFVQYARERVRSL